MEKAESADYHPIKSVVTPSGLHIFTATGVKTKRLTPHIIGCGQQDNGEDRCIIRSSN